MPTSQVALDQTQYVRINAGLNPLVLQSPRDSVRVTLSELKPARANAVFHMLGGEDAPLHFPSIDTNVWALATTDTCSLIVTEFPLVDPNGVTQGGKTAFVTEYGELTVGQKIDDVSISFHTGVSPRSTVDGSAGTGAVALVGSDATISCGTGVGEGRLTSLDSVRYRAGHETSCVFTHNQSAPQAGVDVMHGLLDYGDPSHGAAVHGDGVAVGSKGLDVGLWFIEGNNVNFIAQADWSEDKLDGMGVSGFDLDITKRNLFSITFGYLSIAPIRFYIHTGEKGWVEFHNIILSNTQAEGHLKNPSLPLSCVVTRAAGAGSDVTVSAGSWRAGTTGATEDASAADRWFSQKGSVVNLAAVDTVANPDQYHALFSIKNERDFGTKANHVRAEIMVVTFVTDGNKGVEFVGVFNGVLTGNSSFVSKAPGSSIMSVSTGGTVVGTQIGGDTVLGKIADRRNDVRDSGLLIRPGGVVSVGIRGVGGVAVTGDISVAIRWIEEF